MHNPSPRIVTMWAVTLAFVASFRYTQTLYTTLIVVLALIYAFANIIYRPDTADHTSPPDKESDND